MVKCIKYSFNKKYSHTCNIGLSNYIYYYSDKDILNRIINFADIKQVLYGPRTKTFLKYKKYNPSLVLSIITDERSYDFQFKNLSDIKDFLSKISVKLKIFNIKIPTNIDIDRDYEVLSNKFYDKNILYDPDKLNIEILNLPDINLIDQSIKNLNELEYNILYKEEKALRIIS